MEPTTKAYATVSILMFALGAYQIISLVIQFYLEPIGTDVRVMPPQNALGEEFQFVYCTSDWIDMQKIQDMNMNMSHAYYLAYWIEILTGEQGRQKEGKRAEELPTIEDLRYGKLRRPMGYLESISFLSPEMKSTANHWAQLLGKFKGSETTTSVRFSDAWDYVRPASINTTGFTTDETSDEFLKIHRELESMFGSLTKRNTAELLRKLAFDVLSEPVELEYRNYVEHCPDLKIWSSLSQGHRTNRLLDGSDVKKQMHERKEGLPHPQALASVATIQSSFPSYSFVSPYVGGMVPTFGGDDDQRYRTDSIFHCISGGFVGEADETEFLESNYLAPPGCENMCVDRGVKINELLPEIRKTATESCSLDNECSKNMTDLNIGNLVSHLCPCSMKPNPFYAGTEYETAGNGACTQSLRDITGSSDNPIWKYHSGLAGAKSKSEASVAFASDSARGTNEEGTAIQFGAAGDSQSPLGLMMMDTGSDFAVLNAAGDTAPRAWGYAKADLVNPTTPCLPPVNPMVLLPPDIAMVMPDESWGYGGYPEETVKRRKRDVSTSGLEEFGNRMQISVFSLKARIFDRQSTRASRCRPSSKPHDRLPVYVDKMKCQQACRDIHVFRTFQNCSAYAMIIEEFPGHNDTLMCNPVAFWRALEHESKDEVKGKIKECSKQCSNVPRCLTVQASLEQSSSTYVQHDSYENHNFHQIVITPLDIERILEFKVIPWDTFVANMGGLFGLFFGLSLFQLCIWPLEYCLKKRKVASNSKVEE